MDRKRTLAIPSHQWVQGDKEKYVVFDIFLDGHKHSATRYSTFTALEEEERENFVRKWASAVPLEIHRIGGPSVSIIVNPIDNVEEVRRLASEKFGLRTSSYPYFQLFDVLTNQNGDVISEKNFKAWESPALVIRELSFESYDVEKPLPDPVPTRKLFLKKWLFVKEDEEKVYDDEVALDLIHSEAVDNVRLNKLQLLPATLDKLKEATNSLTYLQHISEDPNYLRIMFFPSLSNFPRPDSRGVICMSRRGIELLIPSKSDEKIIEERHHFRFEKIKYWKYAELERRFSFEYVPVLNGESMQISVTTDQSYYMSTAVHEFVVSLKRKMEVDNIAPLILKKAEGSSSASAPSPPLSPMRESFSSLFRKMSLNKSSAQNSSVELQSI